MKTKSVHIVALWLLHAASLILASGGVACASADDGDDGEPWYSADWEAADQEDDTDSGWSLYDSLGGGPIEYGGWLSAGQTANAHGNRTGNGNSPLSVNNVADGPVLSQLWVYVEKPLDMESQCVDWGFRFDYVFGADGPDLQASGGQGWDFGWTSARDYGSAIPQVYVELGVCDWVLRTGYLIAPLGYESQESILNFFYSHSYTYSFGTPGTLTGAVLQKELTEDFEILAGWSMSWDTWWANYVNGAMFLGGFEWNISEQASLTYYLSAGDYGDGTAKNRAESNIGRLYAHSIVFSYDFSDRTNYVFEHILGSNTGIGTDNNQWYSVTQYLTYEINECWSAGGRIEWFHDEDGARVDTNGSGEGSFYEATLGLNWKPNANIRLRPEARWDWFSGEGLPFDSRDGGNTGTTSHQFTGAVDIVVTF